MENYLLNPRGKLADSQFTSSVSWLLELCGFKVLNLSMIREAEHLRVNEKEEGSCDIIAGLGSGSKSSILIIDCTTAVPIPQKLAKIRLTKDELFKQAATLFEKLQVTVRPTVFVSKDIPELRSQRSSGLSTKIIDQSQLKILLALFNLVNKIRLSELFAIACHYLTQVINFRLQTYFIQLYKTSDSLRITHFKTCFVLK